MQIKRKPKRQMTRTQKIVSRVISVAMVLCIIAAGVFLAKMIPELKSARESDAAFADIAEGKIEAYDPAEKVDGVEKTPDVKNAITVDWDAFKDTEIVAWFQMDNISYPVMQHDDNEYYLKHLPDGSWNAGGSLFLLAESNPLLTDSSSFLYGHNMSSGSMFGSLRNYTTDEYKDHEFYIYLPDGTRHVYKFFAVTRVNQASDFYTWSFASEKSFLDWQQRLLDESYFDTGREVSPENRFLTLSTCSGYYGTTQRLIIAGVEDRVETLQKPASWYEDYLARYEAVRNAWSERSDAIADGLAESQAAARDDLWKSMD